MRVLVLTMVLAGCAPSPAPKTTADERPAEHPKPLVHRFEKAEDWAKEFDDPARDARQKPDLVVSLMKIAEGSTGLVPVGTTGESPTLSHEEHEAVVEAVVKFAGGRVPVIAGAGSNNTSEGIRLIQHAE